MTTWLADQAEMADREAREFVEGVAADTGGSLTLVKAHYQLFERMHATIVGAMEAGRRPQCSHLDPSVPQVRYWHPWAPARQVCETCSEAMERRLAGTPAAHECDGCGRQCPGGLRRGLVSLSLGPAIVPFGFCDRCLAE